MRRWHEDLPLMLRRWRLELRKHEVDPGPYVGAYRRRIPICVTFCHCEKSPGLFRKRAPGDCGRPRCPSCHPSKVFGLPSRHTVAWLTFQLEELAETAGHRRSHIRANRYL